MPDTPVSLAERLLSEGAKTTALWSSLQASHWSEQVYVEGEQVWNAQALLAHFVSAEAMFYELLTQILAGGSGAPEEFDIDAFNARDVPARQGLAPVELLHQFTGLRRQTADLVAGMALEDLQRIGRHPFLGAVPLAESIKLIYRHNQIHQRDLRRLIASQGEGV